MTDIGGSSAIIDDGGSAGGGGAGLQCNEACGFAAAFIGCLCYGTYGVPLKLTSRVVKDCHPFVLQSYKTVVFLVLSWNVLIFEPGVRWTPFGILGGLCWIIGGSCGCQAIIYAGITTAVGTWASVMIIVNFVWGILIFHEPVHSLAGTVGAFCFLILGLLGMTKFAAPTPSLSSSSSSSTKSINDENDPDGLVELLPTVADRSESRNQQYHRRNVMSRFNISSSNLKKKEPSDDDMTVDLMESDSENSLEIENENNISSTNYANYDHDVGYDDVKGSPVKGDHGLASAKPLGVGVGPVIHIPVLGCVITRRQAGIICAVLNGLISGSSLVPLHYAKEQGFTHLSYLISFSTGAAIANLGLWTIYFLVQCSLKCGVKEAWDSIPNFHFKLIWQKMLLAGILLSGGMIGAILATGALGQAVGNSLIQSKIIVSGIWGLCVFREVKDRTAVTKWFISAIVCLGAILWLSYEKASSHAALVEVIEEE